MKLIKLATRALLLGVFTILLVGQLSPSLAQRAVTVEAQAPRVFSEFVVPMNKSQVLSVSTPFDDIRIGNPNIADVLPLTDRKIYVLGKKVGSTNLLIYDENKNLLAVVDLVVSYDVIGLKKRLFDILPKEKIEARAVGDSIVLSGMASSAAGLARAVSIAGAFAPHDKVTNLMRVAGSQQVMLAVRIAEIKRTAVKELGFNTATRFPKAFGNLVLSTSTRPSGLGSALDVLNKTGDAVFTDPAKFATGLIFRSNLALVFDALEKKGVVKTLAEPNLIALSGDTAEFLAGGEIPIPVLESIEGQDSNASITVEFKKFGVGLSFTPTVLENGLINLKVNPEVSTIDTSSSFLIGVTNIPTIITRRASTTVELHDGQSFAIAGLMTNDVSNNIRQFPWLGDIPIIGALFRSSDFTRSESELVILVTAHLVKSSPAGTLSAPTDNYLPPSDLGFFLYGQMEAPGSRLPRGGKAAGGISGNYGHIIK